ncbi:delta-60 repeat domain-containing protein [Desulfobulbus sp.]|uniref:delta-60 repeat domain-containing protein n=1 Tax=Desulfobulbus sp. TaxID=895 RepID=UPI00286F689C|nr:delta-60 repeat domain-containing protein [Desulfobulbus sp.]
MVCRILVFLVLWAVIAGGGGQGAWAFPRLDASFGLNGRVAVELGGRSSGHAVLVQPDGKILVAGSSSQNHALNFSLLRFHADGSLDPGFNGDGTAIASLSPVDDEALALGLLSDGRIVAAGYAHNGRDRDLAMICFRPDGKLDRSFGDEGVVLTSIGNGNEEITALAISPSDMITVAGSTEGTAGRILVVARFTPRGVPDDGFGEQGVSLVAVGEDASVEGILERPDGSFVLSGSYSEKKTDSAMLVGLRSDGSVDPAFGEHGVAIPSGSFAASEGYGIAADRDGRLYLAGSVGPAGRRDAALFCFTAHGEADVSFGEHGVTVTSVSREDDVLYSVDVGADDLAASGFTTDAGTRQFLLLTYPADHDAAVSRGQVGLSSGTAPVQEMLLGGGTKVQLGRLQLWGNDIRIRELQTADSLAADIPPPASAEAAVSAAHGPAGDNGRLASLFPADAQSAAGAKALLPQILATSFSEGESVSYALASDRQGNRVVVGTADGSDASSMVAARFMAEEMIDRILDRPGHRSSHIATAAPAAITRDSVTVDCEIAAAFGQDIVRRGVVFGIHPGPLYTGQGLALEDPPLYRRGADALAAFFLPEAVAATPAPPGSGQDSRQNNRQQALAGRLLATGEVVAGGSGPGGFRAVIDHLLPGTLYYIRAYALTAGGDVYYGNQVNVRTADACFIATASFGSFLNPSVDTLRDFRDTFLLGNRCGRWLVELYYRVSPPLAETVAASAPLRFAGRVLLLPWIGFSWLALHLGLGATLAGAALLGGLAARWLRSRPLR